MANPLRPIIAICGTTGVGKSKLAIDLALQLNCSPPNPSWREAKVINADSMQVYEGLDIITNKVPLSERQGVDHLMMGFKKPGEQYVVGDWVQDTLKLIDEMHRNREIPIVVGGTAYWIQHLLFPNRLVSNDVHQTGIVTPPEWSEDLLQIIRDLRPDALSLFENLPEEPPSAKLDPDSAYQLHSLLTLLDPLVAQRWHWRDTRKVLRSLEIIREKRRLSSQIIAEQSNDLDAQPRFNALCFWLYAQSPLLGARLDERVDEMIKQGLVDEIQQLHAIAMKNATDLPSAESIPNFTLGIYQSIGYREFCTYLENMSPASLAKATERMKLSTRQYAKRQISWIRNKLIPAINAANADELKVPLYLLDATALGNKWNANVGSVAAEIVKGFLAEDRQLPDPRTLSKTAAEMLDVGPKDVSPTAIMHARRKRVCPTCTMHPDRPVMIEEGIEWEAHQRTKSHRRLKAKILRLTGLNLSQTATLHTTSKSTELGSDVSISTMND